MKTIIILITAISITLICGCNNDHYYPEKPFIVVSKKCGALNCTYTLIDKNGMSFFWDNTTINEDMGVNSYMIGDTIQ